MKQRSLLRILTAVIMLFLFGSCTREVRIPIHFKEKQSSFPQTLNLVANHWQQQGSDDVYQNAFNGVMRYGTGSLHTEVYLVTGSGEALINAGKMMYLGGEIWAQATDTDVIVYYHSSCQNLPFGSVNVKLLFE